MSALAARHMSAGYNGVAVVHDVELEVSEGEMVLLAGPNGAGKTTTLMTLCGALTPLTGKVEVDDRETRLPLYARVQAGLGVITEARTIFSGLTTTENLRLGRGRVDSALDHFPELRTRLDVKAGLLSGGEQQMLALGRVLAASPRVIVVDELSLGLAPIVVGRLLKALRAAADSGAAVLLVEQHVRLCLETADRVYFMRRGNIVEHGAAKAYTAVSDHISELYL